MGLFSPVVPVVFDGVDAALDAATGAGDGEQPGFSNDAFVVFDPEEMIFADPDGGFVA